MADLSNFAGNGLLGFLEVKRIPVKMEMMDLLTESLRLYLSVDGKPSIQFVALNQSGSLEPDLDTLKAFYLENGDGVVIRENVWHWTPFALTDRAGFYMGLKNDIMKSSDGVYTVDDTKVKYFTLPEPVGIEL
jgi:ureidoglycolate hydrolase